MRASIVICTFNRRELLQRTLASIGQLQQVDGAGEVVIVDNASTDGTGPWLREHWLGAAPGPGWVRVLVEEEHLGHSYARNAGWRQARGEWVLYTDDDVTMAPDWAARLIAEGEASAADAVCGPVRPVWERSPPGWLVPELWGRLALVDHGQENCWLVEQQAHPVGANFGIRRHVLAELSGFDVRLGRVGSRLSSGEDLDLFRRLRASGRRVRYVAGAGLHHWIPATRLERRYFRRWHWQAGLADAPWLGERGMPCWWGIPRWRYRDAVVSAWRRAGGILSRREPATFWLELRLWYFAGLLVGQASEPFRRLHGRRRSAP